MERVFLFHWKFIFIFKWILFKRELLSVKRDEHTDTHTHTHQSRNKGLLNSDQLTSTFSVPLAVTMQHKHTQMWNACQKKKSLYALTNYFENRNVRMACAVCVHIHTPHIFHKYRFSLLHVYHVRGTVLCNIVHRTRRHYLFPQASQSRLVIINWGHFCSPALPCHASDIWQCLELSLVATAFRGWGAMGMW